MFPSLWIRVYLAEKLIYRNNVKCQAHPNQLKLLYPYCPCHAKKEMHSRDATILIDLLWSPACFGTFFNL